MRGVDHADLGAREQRGEVVAEARDPRADRPERAAVAVQAHDRADGRALRAHELLLALLDGRAAALAAGELPAAAAREEPGAAAPVQHADARARRASTVWRSASASAALEQPVAGFLVALVDDLDRRPAPASTDASARPPRTIASTVGAGVTMRTARAGARARSSATSRAFQVGRTLVLERLVALVEHDDRREVGHRRPHRGATADDDARAARRAVPLARAHRVGMLGAERDDLAAVVAQPARPSSRRARRLTGRARASSPPARARRVSRRRARTDDVQLRARERRRPG